jgi:hypothetical protein
MISHRDGGRNRAVNSWRAFSPGEPVGGRCDGNRGVRFRPLLSLGVRDRQKLSKKGGHRAFNEILTPSYLRGFLPCAGEWQKLEKFAPDTASGQSR